MKGGKGKRKGQGKRGKGGKTREETRPLTIERSGNATATNY